MFKFETSPKLPNSKRYDINVRAVWGSMVTGNGPAHLNEFLATLDSPGMTQNSFSAIEQEIGQWWKDALKTELLMAGAEEREIAISKGNYHGEVPCITVITDGGWSKRTHKHTYNALGGVAIIIGQETKKLLHIGVRHKYCYICNMSQQKQEVPRPHKCFKNWEDSSQSMEADIIVEGFNQAETKHGLRYTKVIGDGDSSTFAKIREEVPIWGKDVVKLECCNHACKCVRSKLEKLVVDNPSYKGRHHLTKAARIRIVSTIRCAIRMRSREAEENGNRHLASQKLSRDIRQSVHHVFGNHTNCSDFCKAKSTSPTLPPCDDNADSHSNNTHVDEVITEQVNMWTDGTSLQAQEEARQGTYTVYDQVDQCIIKDVTNILIPLAEKSSRLIGCLTTNLAESWMHIRSKFDGGKVYNLCDRGSWHGRCYGGALRMNLGPQWSPTVWKSATATEPGFLFSKLYRQRHQMHLNTTTHKGKQTTKEKRWKRKMVSATQANSKKARLSYGPEAIDFSEDVSPKTLDELKEQYLKREINISESKILQIEKSTLQQSHSSIWHTERRKRITASTFGPIIRRNPSIPVSCLVRKHLYSKFRGNKYTTHGLLQEENSLKEYQLKKTEHNINVEIQSSGLVIDRCNKFLGASPDGIVVVRNGEVGLVEVKNVLYNKPLNLYQAAETQKNFCLELKEGKLTLRENHDYFYQCHGLMKFCDKPWIDLVVRTSQPYQMYIQRIFRNIQLWENKMLPKLESFYFKALLPELTSLREGKSPGIREPGIWYNESAKKNVTRRSRRTHSKTTAAKSNVPTPTSHTSTLPSENHEVTKAPPCNEAIAGSSASTSQRLSRARTSKVKYVGRTIKQQWVIDENKNQREWYKGTVLSVVSGVDGAADAVYEVQYEGEEDPYEVDHLLEDYRSSALVFMDI